MLCQAVRACLACRSAGIPLTVAVNVSVPSLAAAGWPTARWLEKRNRPEATSKSLVPIAGAKERRAGSSASLCLLQDCFSAFAKTSRNNRVLDPAATHHAGKDCRLSCTGPVIADTGDPDIPTCLFHLSDGLGRPRLLPCMHLIAVPSSAGGNNATDSRWTFS